MKNMSIVCDLPSPEEVRAAYPLSDAHHVEEHRDDVRSIIERRDPRKLLLVGPCSVSSGPELLEYAERLAGLQARVRDHLKLVLRVYTQKPRTTTGWTGIMQEPDPLSGIADPVYGIYESRRIMHEAGQMLPLVDEMLYTENADYVEDLLSYIAVGARNSESQIHRQVASGLDMPVGIKNPTSGNIKKGVEGVIAAQAAWKAVPHRGRSMATVGNAHAHLILRGGDGKPNYDDSHIAQAHDLLLTAAHSGSIRNPAVLVDASHENSIDGNGAKSALQQPRVIASLLDGMSEKRAGYASVIGYAMESNLVGGKQPIGPNRKYGMSLTDDCLGWQDTEDLVLEIRSRLSRIS